jgi:calcyphosin
MERCVGSCFGVNRFAVVFWFRGMQVTPDEFERYYATLSASIDSDDYFELMIRNAWHISGGEGWSQNTTCRRVLVTRRDGSQQVVEIKNDIGLGNDLNAIKAALKRQGEEFTVCSVVVPC